MPKPQHNPELARQFGAINNILRLSSRTPRVSRSDRRVPKAEFPSGSAQAAEEDRRQSRPFKDSKPDKQSRQSQNTRRSDQITVQQQDRRRSRLSSRSSAVHVDHHLSRLQHRAEDLRGDRYQPRPPQDAQQLTQSGLQSHTRTLEEEPKRSRAVFSTVNGDSPASSGKRKRTTADIDNDDTQCAQATKKQQNLHPNADPNKCPLAFKHNRREIVALKSVVTTTTPFVQGQSPPNLKTATQVPTPPSSCSAPDSESCSKKVSKTSAISIPTSTKKVRRDQYSSLLMDIQPAKSKRKQHDEQIDRAEKHKRPFLQVQARAVRPESSFAPVAPNHECEVQLLDYSHDSIPILYSSMIEHCSSGNFLNIPSGTLAVDALAIIGPSIDPQAKRGWPSIIDLPDRAASQSHPVRIIDDVDLYLDSGENKLCVATDRGLLTILNYLELIGVPEGQSIRFQGCVPPWARTAFRTPVKRRIVWLERQHAGKMELASTGTALGTHQIASTILQIDLEVEGKPTHPNDSKAQVVAGSETSQLESKQEKPKFEGLEVLSAKPGNLPLRAGSIVLVYAVDDEGVFAYGRLSGTDNMGRLPMAFTCPIDWSLDKYSKTRNDLNEPFMESKDHIEKNWEGVYHWLRQGQFAFGLTWKQTLELGAAKARDERERNLAASKLRMRTQSHKKDDTEARAERSEVLETSIERPFHDLTPTSPVMTAALSVIATAPIERQVQGALFDVSSSRACKNVKISDYGGGQAGHPAREAEAYERTSKDEIEATVALEQDISESVEGVRSAPETRSLDSLREELGDSDEQTGKEVADKFIKAEESEAIEGNTDREAKAQMIPGNEVAETIRASEAPVDQDPFSKPRLSMFARNDDIEYDWGDSDMDL